MKGRGAPQQEEVRIGPVLIALAGPVVVHLVVVPDRCPRRGCMGRLEVGVGAIEGVAVPVLLYRQGLGRAFMRANAALLAWTLVDVVAKVHDQVGSVLGQMTASRVEAILIILTGRK